MHHRRSLEDNVKPAPLKLRPYGAIQIRLLLLLLLLLLLTGRYRQTTECVLPLTHIDLFRSLRTALTLADQDHAAPQS